MLAFLLLSLLPVGAAPLPPESSPDSLIVEWTPPLPDFRPLPDGSVELVAEGYEIDERPGALRLPFTSSLIAIPPGASISLRILSAQTTIIPLPAPLAIAPEPIGVVWDEGYPAGPAYAPTTRAIHPLSTPVTLEEIGTARGVRLARLIFYPALPEGESLRFFRYLRVEVRFSGGATFISSSSSGSDPLLAGVRRAVLNPQHAISALPAAWPVEKTVHPQGGPRKAFLEISRPGLYRVTYQDLEPLGFAQANPANIHLFRGEDEAAYEWEGDEDTVFEPGEAVLFYAEPRFSRWTNVDVYRLEVGESAGLRMTSRSADPAGSPAGTPWVEQTFEENRLYTPDRLIPGIPPGRDGDRWVWADLRRPGSPVFSTTFPLNVDASSAATLTLWLIGYTSVVTNPDHRVDVVLNNIPLGRVEWDGKTAVTATLAISPNVLAPTNTLRFSLPGIPGVGVEGAWLDAFVLHLTGGTASWGYKVIFTTPPPAPGDAPPADFPYRLYLPLVVRGGSGGSATRAYTVRLNPSRAYRAYDITDPLRPIRVLTVRVEGGRVTVPDPGDRPRRYLVVAEEAIRVPDHIRPWEDPWGFRTAGGAIGADYLIITHPAFAGVLGPLVDLRRSQGLSVAVINVLGLYDTYGDGRPDPEAIRRFVADAYANWSPRPTHVLLVGDGSYDPKRYRSESPPTFIPPYLADADPQAGETAADNRYVCVDGDDNLPDLLLGRLPVKTADEARAVVGKIVDYETRPLPGGWNGTVLLVADDPDPAGNFPALSDVTAARVTAPFTVTRRYCPKDTCASEAPHLRATLLNDWNKGALLIQYFGHSSWQQWAAERLFHLDDLPSLANSRRYLVVTEMTCFTGAFHRPEPTLDEALVTRPEAGAVAAWGPASLGTSTGHSRLAEGFFRAVFSDTVVTVGEATLAGKLNLAGAPQGSDLLDTYVLLGDPALRWNRTIVPWSTHLYLPLVVRNSP